MASTPSATATFCATLVDEWIRIGVRHAVLSPGSRSTPMALALSARTEISLHVFHDERSASFAALGIGQHDGVPAVLLCTSGTAAVQFHAAVVEADHAHVPMLVCTADRPPELQGVGRRRQSIKRTYTEVRPGCLSTQVLPTTVIRLSGAQSPETLSLPRWISTQALFR